MTDKPSDELDLDLPDAAPEPPAVKHHEISDAFNYDVAFKMGFVGIGQGGGRIAETFYNLGYRRVAAINSAYEDLKDISDDIAKLDMKTGGAGQDMDRGREFLEKNEDGVWDLLVRAAGDDPDYLLVCVSLGGGTGSGGAAKLVEICRKYMAHNDRENRVGVVVSLPNSYEGQRTCANSVKAFEQLYNLQPSPMIIIDNKRIEKLYRRGATDFFPTCNQQVAKLFHLFNRLATERSKLVTFDRADYAVLLDSGIVVFGASPITKYEDKADIRECIRTQLEQTVLAEVDMKKGRAAGCIFLGNEEIMGQVPMDFFGAGFDQMNQLMSDGSVVYRGVYVGKSNDLRCYSMLSGLPAPIERLRELKRKSGIQQPPSTTMDHLEI